MKPQRVLLVPALFTWHFSVILSCHLVTLSPNHLVTLPPCHLVTLLFSYSAAWHSDCLTNQSLSCSAIYQFSRFFIQSLSYSAGRSAVSLSGCQIKQLSDCTFIQLSVCLTTLLLCCSAVQSLNYSVLQPLLQLFTATALPGRSIIQLSAAQMLRCWHFTVDTPLLLSYLFTWPLCCTAAQSFI